MSTNPGIENVWVTPVRLAGEADSYGSSVPTSPSPAESLAQQLLDAQVAYHLDRLTGKQLESTVTRLADELLARPASTRSMTSSTASRSRSSWRERWPPSPGALR